MTTGTAFQISTKKKIDSDAVSFSVKKSVNEISDLLVSLYEAYISNRYKERFDWFDNFSSINDSVIVSELNNKIIEKINDDNKTDVIYWLSIPEVISWERTKCFKYNLTSDNQEYQDIFFSDFRESLKEEKRQNIKVDDLNKKKVFQIDVNDNTIDEWPIYKCLYAEIDFNGDKYLLVSGKYYRVDIDYKKKVEDEFTVDTSFVLPDWAKTHYEPVYTAQVTGDDASYQCFDGGVDPNNLIGKGKIEFADLVRSDKHLIHIKKYGASSVLSHLFSQGLVSATLLLTDKSFREKVSKKLKDSHKDILSADDIRPEDYTIVYAIGTSASKLKLPFFSLVNYRNAKKQLELYRYKVKMVKIKQI